jgi:CRP-like cAMP-binding protein
MSVVGHKPKNSTHYGILTPPMSKRNVRRTLPHANRILHALPGHERRLLESKLENVELAQRRVVYQPNERIEHVYFPLSGVLSVVMESHEGLVEVATIGNEGIVGIAVFLGASSTSEKAFSQIPGEALRIKSSTFRRVLPKTPTLSKVLNKYVQTLMTQMAQGAACNRLHSPRQRCARWLLMTHDRVQTESFQLTQEFLGLMLGVRRTGVSEVASSLQRAGLIEYSRGEITVVDRSRLEKLACDCYAVIRGEFDRPLH